MALQNGAKPTARGFDHIRLTPAAITRTATRAQLLHWAYMKVQTIPAMNNAMTTYPMYVNAFI